MLSSSSLSLTFTLPRMCRAFWRHQLRAYYVKRQAFHHVNIGSVQVLCEAKVEFPSGPSHVSAGKEGQSLKLAHVTHTEKSGLINTSNVNNNMDEEKHYTDTKWGEWLSGGRDNSLEPPSRAQNQTNLEDHGAVLPFCIQGVYIVRPSPVLPR